MQSIPFFKQALINADHSWAAIEAIQAMAEGRFSLVLGHYSRKFEEEFTKYLGCAQFSLVSNGLDALMLALQALDIGAEDEVIVPAHTYIATWLAPLRLGCRLVACPVKASNLLMDENHLAALVTSRTRCIMPVHLYGNACNMEAIMNLAMQHDLKVIEDAAQAHGTVDSYSGKYIGCHGDAVAFSFYPTKNLGAIGEGGGVSCRDANVAKKIQSLRNYGRRPDDGAVNDMIGLNARGDEVQAAFLSSKLLKLDLINEHRRSLIKLYKHHLTGDSLPISLIHYDDNLSAPHLAILRCHNSADRNPLIQHLRSQGIETAVHYRVPCHQQPCVIAASKRVSISDEAKNQAQGIADSILSIPMSECHTEREIRAVAKAIEQYFIG